MSDQEKRKQSAVARRLAFNVDQEFTAAIQLVTNNLNELEKSTNLFISTTTNRIAALTAGLTKVTNIINAQFDPTDASSWEARLIALETLSITGTTDEVEVTFTSPYGYQIGLPNDVIISDSLSADNLIARNLGKLKLNNLTNSVSVSHSCPSTLANNHEYIWPISMGLTKESLMIQSFPSPRVAQLVWYTPVFLNEIQTFTAKQSFTSGIDVTGSINGPGSGTLTISNGAGDVVITSPITTIGNGVTDFIIDAASSTVDGSLFEWQTGDLATGTLFAGGNITLQNNERIQNSTNGRVDIAPAPSASSFGLSIDMTSKGTGARLTTVTGTAGTTLSTGVLESLVEFQSPKFTLTTITLSTSVGGCLEYDGKVIYGNAASGRGVVPVMQISSVATTKSLNSATGNQNIFDVPQDVITLAASTTYIIRGYLYLTTGTTTTRHLTLRFTESVTVNPPTIHFTIIGTPSTGGAALRTQDTAFFNTTAGGQITNATFNTNSYNAWITGVIKTVDSVTITPQIAFSAAPGNTNTVNFGTYIAFIPVGSNTLAAVGPWS
jgi:hypothetical protein